MTDTNLLASDPGAATAPDQPEVPPAAPTPADAARPAYVPDKFWDGAKGEIRVEALAKSYAELERRLSRSAAEPAAPPDPAAAVPATPDGYAIDTAHGLFSADAEINTRLHAAGFTPAQAQLVYDLAAERLVPMVQRLAGEFEQSRQLDRLVAHFGGDEKWGETARQLDAWGRAHLPPEVFGALASTYEGVVALHRMMGSGEPGLGARAGAGAGLSEEALRAMIRDPRYWRERDPALVARVADGYRRLYPERDA